MTKRKAKKNDADVYGSGLPKGRKLKRGETAYSGGLCTVPPNVRTTDDLVRLVRGELRDLLEIALDLLAGNDDPATRRDQVVSALIYDASRWCVAIADALESGKWPELNVDDATEAARMWADAAAQCASIEEGAHEQTLAFCARALMEALPAKREQAAAASRAAEGRVA